jgi:hypothetical protein
VPSIHILHSHVTSARAVDAEAFSALRPRVTTDYPCTDGIDEDDVKVSKHFFSLKLSKSDLVNVLNALKNASVVTDPTNRQVVNNGGPKDVQALVNSLGKKSKNKSMTKVQLLSGVGLISKPSTLHVPP